MPLRRLSYHSGFTLIELVIVIVILGVLSAIAAPKFIDIRKNARIAVIENVAGTLKSTSSLIQHKATIQHVTDGAIAFQGKNIAIEGGYIAGHWNSAWRFVIEIGKDITYTRVSQPCTLNDICAVGNQTNAPGLPISTNTNGLILLWPNGYTLSDRCYAYYYNPKTGQEPSTGSVTTGC